jgi:16S rRNA (cytosine1402-N4)-methyltransferase
MNKFHQPVMAKEVLNYLISPSCNGVYIDCTAGSGGHSQFLLENCSNVRIIAFDQDQAAIFRCQQNSFFSSQTVTFINDNFVNFPSHLSRLNITSVDGFLFDLGVSSEQLADTERGFSYRQDSPLDMRMDERNELTAQDIVNSYNYQELVKIFSDYGEERKAKKIAERICQYRKKEKITTTQQLVKIIISCQTTKSKKHPARRVFQALRIAVNRELVSLAQTLELAFSHLNIGGKIVVISYHSLEDRIVKQIFKKYNRLGFQVVAKKPVVASDQEVNENRRARSAKMRVITRLS